MVEARGKHRRAAEHHASSMQAIRHTNAEVSRARDDVHSKFTQKIKNSEVLSQKLSSRIRANKSSTEHTEWSLSKIAQAIQDIDTPIHVCKSRIAMRQRRPKRELVFDSFQEALLQEEKILMATKVRLQSARDDSQAILAELRRVREDLERDLAEKQHGLSLDVHCVAKVTRGGKLDKVYDRQGAVLSTVEAVNSARQEAETTGQTNEKSRQNATLRDIDMAEELERNVKAHLQDTSAFLDSAQKTRAAAAKATQEEMRAKIEHTELLKQELVKQCKLTDGKIAETNKMLVMVSEKLEYIGRPMTANAFRQSIRNQRTQREGDSDEVTESLHNQMHALRAKKPELQGRIEALAQTLRELQAARAELAGDIADKDKALAIDRGCAATKNAAHGTLSYGFSKVGQGERHFAETASSMLRQVPPLSAR